MAFAGLWERWWVLEGAALPGSLARTAPGRCRRDLPHPHHRGQRHHARAASPDAGDLVAEGVYDLACRRGCQARTGAGGPARDASSQSTTLATTTRSVWPRLRSGRILRQGTTGMRGGLKRGASGMLAAGVARLQCTHQPTCENATENNRLEELCQPTNPGSRPTSRTDALTLLTTLELFLWTWAPRDRCTEPLTRAECRGHAIASAMEAHPKKQLRR